MLKLGVPEALKPGLYPEYSPRVSFSLRPLWTPWRTLAPSPALETETAAETAVKTELLGRGWGWGVREGRNRGGLPTTGPRPLQSHSEWSQDWERGFLGVKVKVKSKSELVLAPPPPCMHPLLRIHNPGTTRISRQGKVEIKGVDRQGKIDSAGWGSGVQSGSMVCVYVCVYWGEK